MASTQLSLQRHAGRVGPVRASRARMVVKASIAVNNKPTPLANTIFETRAYQMFMNNVSKDNALSQDYASFLAQPWFDRPMYHLNSHPAVQDLFTEGKHPETLAKLRKWVADVDSVITKEDMVWLAAFAKAVTSAPVVYTGMTNMFQTVGHEQIQAMERTIDVMLNPQRLEAAIDIMSGAIGPQEARQMMDSFRAFFDKQRLAKWLNVADQVLTDDHWAKIREFVHQIVPYTSEDALQKASAALDQALSRDQASRLFTALAKAAASPEAIDFFTKLDDALPEKRTVKMILAYDAAMTNERIDRTPAVVESVSASASPSLLPRIMALLVFVFTPGRMEGYKRLAQDVANSPARLEKWVSWVESQASEDKIGQVLDEGYKRLGTPQMAKQTLKQVEGVLSNPLAQVLERALNLFLLSKGGRACLLGFMEGYLMRNNKK